jgi:hypothetical protein
MSFNNMKPFLLLLLQLTATFADDQLLTSSHDNSPECDCYLTTGPEQGYFQYYRFFDFRSISPQYFPSSVPKLVLSSDAPADPSNPADVTSGYFTLPEYENNWLLQNFTSSDSSTGAAYEQVTTPANIWVGSDCGDPDSAGNDTCLVLRSSRRPEFQSTVEMDCLQGNMWRASIRARLRVVPTSEYSSTGGGSGNADNAHSVTGSKIVEPGAVVGFFTFGSDKSESDIEILTRDPVNHIRYSNQPDYDAKTGNDVPGASTDAVMPDGKNWTQWITHRLDWFDGVSQYWVDDVLVLNKTKNVPPTPGGAVLNLWGDGGEWSGNMTVGGEVRVEVAWIDMAFNVSGDINGPEDVGQQKRGLNLLEKRDKHCDVGCWVDQGRVGYPVKAFNATGNDGVALGVEGGVWKWVMVALGQAVVVYVLQGLVF